MTTKPTRDLVLARVREVFPHHSPADVFAVLDLYGVEPYERERERVQLDILKLSEGDIDKLRNTVALAKRDYRDVIVAAEYTNLGRRPPDH